MPNWCECDVRVSGPESKLQEFKQAVACPDDKSVFRINNILPTPVSLLDAPAGAMEILHEIVNGSDEQFKIITTLHGIETTDRKEAFEIYVSRNNIDGAKCVELAETYKRNMEVYGHQTWYSWRIANWGTKWDTNNSSIVEERYQPGGSCSLIYVFDTAWSPPTEALTAISKRFSFLTFRMRYFECGMGFKGFMKLRNGAVLSFKSGGYSGSRGG